MDFGLGILDLWNSADFIKKTERSDTANPKSKFYNPKSK
ncbi:hypothetical protein D1AOALGA4SA_4104 [Olavius algarvensis Delta 1 endosymbiont]|nr:hypothetical protein D1AOALGA4SA_4104 [Olavius algarvensis Delta 1 endosymbiont]